MHKTILIVDDSASIRQMVNDVLSGDGYEVIEATDGLDALSKLAGRRIHLILSDVYMPNMGGIAFVREIKKLNDYKFTPVIMLTTESRATMKSAGQAVGARGWLIKPILAQHMLEVVSKLAAA